MEFYFWPSIIRTQSSIGRPVVNANTFEINLNIIQMVKNNVQFNGLLDEDPYVYIANFLEV